MKHLRHLALSVLLVLALSVTAMAAEVPVGLKVENLNGQQRIVKTYELPPGTDPETLKEPSFDYDGFNYTWAYTTKDEHTFLETKTVTETVTVETGKKDLNTVLEQLASSIPYDDGEFSGELVLDHTTITTKAAGYVSKSGKVTTTKTIGPLDRNDMSYIPATTVKDGKTLTLANVEWQVIGTDLVGDVLAPSSYQAVATYSASTSYQVATGYVSTAEYKGTVTASGIESITYTVVYVGTEIVPETPQPTEPAEQDSPLPGENAAAIGGVLLVIALLAALAGLGAYLFLHRKSERIPNVTFEIRRVSDQGLVKTVTTDKKGRVYAELDAGNYYAVETECPKEFKCDPTPHYFTVTDGKNTTLTVTNKPFSGIILHKIDSMTGEGIYNVKFLVYDQDKNPIGEYSTDNRGYIYIDDMTVQGKGRLYIRELEAAPGYELDKEYKTVYLQPGKTIELEWKNTPITGQFQIYKYAAAYNEVTGTPAGAPLQGAVYEISEARSGKVVDYITTDACGVAASKPLPLGRYKIVEVTAPAYWQVSGVTFDETLEHSGQIIKVSDYDKPSNLGVSITKRGNAESLAGRQMRYNFTVANTSNVPLSDFYWHDRIPTDATRATVFTTGTYSARLNYRILYKTNCTGTYQVLASNLLTSSNYSFSLNAIPTQSGEYVTDIYLDFGKVPVGFQSTSNPTLTVQILGTAANGYQIINRADVGGKYQSTWQTAQTSWVTTVRKLTPTPTLPKTGY